VLSSRALSLPCVAALAGCVLISNADLQARLLDGDTDSLLDSDTLAFGAWAQISTGDQHTCGRRAGGTLWCWGRGASGERGDGALVVARDRPSRVVGSGETEGGEGWSDWTSVSAGWWHTCGVRANGTAWCWGLGTAGQRGDGAKTSQRENPAPVLAAGEPQGSVGWSDWATISAGGSHSCGVRDDGTAWCWGDGGNGQRGSGAHRARERTTPERVVADDVVASPWTDWELVSAGWQHTCGIREGGTLWCWGAHDHGQLGIGPPGDELTPRSRPEQVIAQDPTEIWVDVSAGQRHTCGVLDVGTLWCWGWGDNGQLGDGEMSTSHIVWSPTLVVHAEGGHADTWDRVSAGGSHTCATRADGSAWCWGRQAMGRLGNGVDRPQGIAHPQPVDAETWNVEPWTDWLTIAAGGAHSCGVRDGRGAWCWGAGAEGQRGDATNSEARPYPSTTDDGADR